MVKKIVALTSLSHRYQKPLEDWEYIEDPTYKRSKSSHVCMTCSKFDYTKKASCGSILCCNWHQKLIFQGQHLTHSCVLYQKKASLIVHRKLNHKPQAT